MIINAIGMTQSVGDGCSIVNATGFSDLLKNFDEPLWDGCTNHNILLVVAHVVHHQVRS